MSPPHSHASAPRTTRTGTSLKTMPPRPPSAQKPRHPRLRARRPAAPLFRALCTANRPQAASNPRGELPHSAFFFDECEKPRRSMWMLQTGDEYFQGIPLRLRSVEKMRQDPFDLIRRVKCRRVVASVAERVRSHKNGLIPIRRDAFKISKKHAESLLTHLRHTTARGAILKAKCVSTR